MAKRSKAVKAEQVAVDAVVAKVDAAVVAETAADRAAAKAAAKEIRKAAAVQARSKAHEQIRELCEAEAAKRLCLCGCGAQTPKAFFVPGHDAKLLSRLMA